MWILNKLRTHIDIYRKYKSILHKYNSTHHSFDASKPIVYFDLADYRLEYLYQLIYTFTINGYNVYLRKRYNFIGNTVKHNSYMFNIPTLKLISKKPSEYCKYFIYDHNSSLLQDKFYEKALKINYNIYQNPSPTGITFMIPMSHDTFNEESSKQLNVLRNRDRAMKVFFSGNVNPNSYNKPIVNTFFKILTRIQILDIIKNKYNNRVYNSKDSNELLNKISKKSIETPIVYCNWYWVNKNDYDLGSRIPAERWLDVLAASDFFLACPGVVMPFCYNLAESMYSGTIPIIQFGNLFHPPLENMKNCIAFTDEESLIKAIEIAINLSEDKIKEMRKEVIRYYDEHLSPQAFCKKLEEKTEDNFDILIHGQSISLNFIK